MDTGDEDKARLSLSAVLARRHSNVPCAVGFGISTPQQAKEMADISDGVIVGSGIVELLEKYGRDAPEHIGRYVKKMKDAVCNPKK